MTTDRDFDRLARAWLDLLPDEAPDQAVDAVLQAVETTPQVRRPWRRLIWRFPAMNRAPVLIGAAAVIAVAGLAALFVARSGPPGATVPTPSQPNSPSSSSPSAAAIVASDPVPTEILGRWMGDHSDLVQANAGTTILFTATDLTLSHAATDSRVVLQAAAAGAGSGRFRLEATDSIGGCAPGAAGQYGWSRSGTGRTLTITTEQDACAGRADAVAGTWWLMGCKDPTNYCLGELSAGTYASQYIAPRLDRDATWSADFGALSYTVPDGWANSSDLPGSFELMPASVFATAAAGSADRGFAIATQPAPLAKNAACESLAPNGRGSTVDELVSWIADVPGLVSTAPTPIRIGGLAGQWFDLRADPAFTTGCNEGGTTIVEYQTAMYSGLTGTERQRLIYLDLGGGDVASITIRTTDPAAFDAFVAEAMPIIESLIFE